MQKNIFLKLMYVCVLLLAFTIQFIHTQSQPSQPVKPAPGKIYGRVTDSETGDKIIGANIMVVGTTIGGITDIDGKYLISRIPPGIHQLRVSMIGYTSKLINEVDIQPGFSISLDINITSETITQDEVVITAKAQRNTESAILASQKKAATIGDGISMEQVKRTPDATSSDVLKRVTGVSIVDNKFVFVRGVTDRYNATTLNGTSVTSTNNESDKGSFAFDMVPASLIENINVTKTATPDLPGDFTGGLVQLTTLDFPENQLYKFSLSGSYNDITTSKNIRTTIGGGKTDWLGYDDGSRDYPEGVVDPQERGRILPNTWGQRVKSAPLNGSANLTLGGMVGEDEFQFGYIGSLSYANGFQRYVQTYDNPKYSFIAHGNLDVHSIMVGTLLDLNFRIGRLHKISIKNNLNQLGEDKARYLITEQDDADTYKRTYLSYWGERSSYLGQIISDNSFPELGGMDVTWRGSYQRSNATEPDSRLLIYSRHMRAPESELVMAVAKRSWAETKEQTRNSGVDISIPFPSIKFKFGGVVDEKRRDYKIKFYLFELAGAAFSLPLLPPDSIFAPQNFDAGEFSTSRLSSPRDEYDGKFLLYAAYTMVDVPFSIFSENFRFTGGVRMENNEQRVNTISPFSTNTPYTVRTKVVDYLPSLNFTYLFNEVTNLRFAYSNSVDRPEFRELSNFYFYDYTIYEGKYGNPLLARALSRNYDVRFEIYPNIGELFAVSYFYKALSNAIEETIIPSSNPERTWFNSPKGKNFGWEFEIRKSFDFLGDYFRNIAITGNYTLITSKIDYRFAYVDPDVPGRVIVVTRQREMQGQSPFMINLSFLYTEPTLGTSLNILFNKFGRKIDAVADYREDDIYEEARGVIDCSINQIVSDEVSIKFSVKDIGAKERVFKTREGNPYRTIFTGTSVSLQAGISL